MVLELTILDKIMLQKSLALLASQQLAGLNFRTTFFPFCKQFSLVFESVAESVAESMARIIFINGEIELENEIKIFLYTFFIRNLGSGLALQFLRIFPTRWSKRFFPVS